MPWIHFRSADTDGTAMGRQIAEYALRNRMQPKTHRCRTGSANPSCRMLTFLRRI